MRGSHIAGALGLLATLVVAAFAGTVSSAQGGLLGSLRCGLAGGSAGTTTATTAARLTKVAKSSGLAAAQPVLTLPLQATSTQQAAAVCTVLDLTLGPLDLNLLGLIVHLG